MNKTLIVIKTIVFYRIDIGVPVRYIVANMASAFDPNRTKHNAVYYLDET